MHKKRSPNCIWPGDKKRLVSCEEMLWLSSRNIKIKHLFSCRPRPITDNIAVIIAGFGIHLIWLKIDERRVNDIRLIRITEGCPSLRSLDISSCLAITDMSIIRIAECCRHLEKLDMTYCSYITDTSLIRLAEGCPNIKDLDLMGCRNISDGSIIKIAEC